LQRGTDQTDIGLIAATVLMTDHGRPPRSDFNTVRQTPLSSKEEEESPFYVMTEFFRKKGGTA
jgi:hypothetical protein